MSKSAAIQVGDLVKLKRGAITLPSQDGTNYNTATVQAFLSDVEGGVVLDRRIEGFKYWNVLDLIPASSTSDTRKK